MKGFWMKICAVLLVVWYCMSIIGFDVHTCKGSGRAFVTTFAEGMTCADIHPEHHCCRTHHEEPACSHHESLCCHEKASSSHQEPDCCGHHGPDSQKSVDLQTCCTDSYQVIILTGCRAEDDGHDSDGCGFSTCLYADVLSANDSLKYKSSTHYGPDLRDIVPSDCCVTFCIWRI